MDEMDIIRMDGRELRRLKVAQEVIERHINQQEAGAAK